jgi:hypothetical protein
MLPQLGRSTNPFKERAMLGGAMCRLGLRTKRLLEMCFSMHLHGQEARVGNDKLAEGIPGGKIQQSSRATRVHSSFPAHAGR